jgi:hypothetical protein
MDAGDGGQKRRVLRRAVGARGQGRADHVVHWIARPFFSERGAVLNAFTDCFADERPIRSQEYHARQALDRYSRGSWALCARWIADGDRDRVETILEWPLADLLHAFRLKLQRESRSQYQDELTVWAMIAPHVKKAPDPPDVPAILSE